MSDVATKEDIRTLDESLAKQGDELRAEMKQQSAELRADMKQQASDLRAEMKQQASDLRTEMKQQGKELRTEIRSSFDDLTALLRTFMEQVDERFRRIEEEQRQIKADINRLFDYMDKIAKRLEIDEQERLVMGHQLERLDRWTHELADKIGYTLSA